MRDRTRIVVHPVAPTGGKRVVAHVHGTDSILGTAYSVSDVAEFLRRIGVEHAEDVVAADDPLVEWRGGDRTVCDLLRAPRQRLRPRCDRQAVHLAGDVERHGPCRRARVLHNEHDAAGVGHGVAVRRVASGRYEGNAEGGLA